MNSLQTLNTVITMSSREIAELTGKQHKNVLRDIDRLLETLSSELSSGYKSSTYISGDPPREYRQFEMDRDSSICLVAGYDVNARMRIIKRWQELESNPLNQLQPLPLTPHDLATRQLKNELEVAALFECPTHIGQQEAVKRVRKDTGIDFSNYLKSAPAQQKILQHEVMLEPTELGVQLNLGSGRATNLVLESLGLQRRVNHTWVPTDRGEVLSHQHAWTSGDKSGYNLKWNVNKVKELLEDLM